MSYLLAQAATSALNGQLPGAQPQRLRYRFLQQETESPYFRAFAADSLRYGELLALAEAHLTRAAQAAGWAGDAWHRAPVFIGSASYDLPEYESSHHADRSVQHYSLHRLADDLQARSGNPEIFSFASTCTSSAHALMQAHHCLRRGSSERAFVLGVESLNRMSLLHFHSLGLFADSHRAFGGKGLILGEGIAALALGSRPPEGARLQLLGQGANTGTDLIQSDGQAQERLMRRVLKAAGVAAEAVCAVKTHGVGTADSDAAEYAALARIFPQLPPLLAFKSQLGHSLGASGALETAHLACCLAAGAARDYRGRLQRLGSGCYLANFFGFGGSNTVMLWRWTA